MTAREQGLFWTSALIAAIGGSARGDFAAAAAMADAALRAALRPEAEAAQPTKAGV